MLVLCSRTDTRWLLHTHTPLKCTESLCDDVICKEDLNFA